MRFAKQSLLAILLFPGLFPELSSAGEKASVPSFESSAADRRALSLAIYSQNLALVREKRAFNRPGGILRLRFSDISEKIIPSSVAVESECGLKVLEQEYQYDLLAVDKLLEKYIGREVTLERLDKRTNTPEKVTGILLSLDGGRIMKFGDRVEIDPEGRFILPEVPENFVTRPSLTWLMDSGKNGGCMLDVSYLTTGIFWSCDYVLELDHEKSAAELSGWVSIDNRSGAEFQDAELILVAGELNRAVSSSSDRIQMLEMKAAPQMAAQAAGGSFEREESFEYYRYCLQRKTNLPDKQVKQIELFRLEGLKPERIYRLEGGQNFYFGPMGETPREEQVPVYLEWVNGGANYPGMPLPAGLVRIYETEPGGAKFFSGEDRIGHTPAERKISLKAGKAFDLVAERKQTEFKRLSDRLRQVSMEIKLVNRKKEAVIVQVEEVFPGDWKITGSSHPYEKLSSNRVKFSPGVPPGGTVTVVYSVQLL